MKVWLRRTGLIVMLGVVGACAMIALRGPQGIPALMEKRREIRELQEKNDELRRDIERRRDRIRKLTDSQSEQEMEIRKKLKLLKPGETTFILPDTPAEPAKEQPPAIPPAPGPR